MKRNPPLVSAREALRVLAPVLRETPKKDHALQYLAFLDCQRLSMQRARRARRAGNAGYTNHHAYRARSFSRLARYWKDITQC